MAVTTALKPGGFSYSRAADGDQELVRKLRGPSRMRWTIMRSAWRLTAILLLVAGPLGCRSHPALLKPPGTIEKQRFNATVFDPYADNDIGPEVVGGRPKDYQKPLSEPDRSRLFQKTWLPF
jgi:hypothetical protein